MRDLEEERFRQYVRQVAEAAVRDEVDPELQLERDLLLIRAEAQREAWGFTSRPWPAITAPGVH